MRKLIASYSYSCSKLSRPVLCHVGGFDGGDEGGVFGHVGSGKVHINFGAACERLAIVAGGVSHKQVAHNDVASHFNQVACHEVGVTAVVGFVNGFHRFFIFGHKTFNDCFLSLNLI